MRIVRTHKRIEDVDDTRECDCEVDDSAILPPQERFCAGLDGVGNLPHLGRACVALHDIAHEVERKQQPDDAGAKYEVQFH